MGSDTATPSSSSSSKTFQFTLPHGERPKPWTAPAPSTAFQFTLPHGERPGVAKRSDRRPRFNSRSRMGSDIRANVYALDQDVSIHAPAWGATVAPDVTGVLAKVSIHAPAWGATWHPRPVATGPSFQFTLPHGERHDAGVCPASLCSFNSRSRMGSDAIPAECAALRSSFNSRSRMGSDATQTPGPNRSPKFQFTLPHGERPSLF